MVYTLNPLIESPELMLLYKKPETIGFYASPMHAISANDHISENIFIIFLCSSHPTAAVFVHKDKHITTAMQGLLNMLMIPVNQS